MSKIASTPSQKPEISVPLLRAEIDPEYEDDEEKCKSAADQGDITSCTGSVTEHSARSVEVMSRPAQGARQSTEMPGDATFRRRWNGQNTLRRFPDARTRGFRQGPARVYG